MTCMGWQGLHRGLPEVYVLLRIPKQWQTTLELESNSVAVLFAAPE